MIPVGPLELGIAGFLVLLTGICAHLLRLGISRSIAIAAVRTVAQLLLIGLVLKALFASTNAVFIGLLSLLMLAIAGREVLARQHRRLKGWWGYGIGTTSMFLSSFTVTILALQVIIAPDPWYTPQYAIPLLGMLLGNTMTGVSLGLDRLTEGAWERRGVIEARLMLGEDWNEAIGNIRRQSIRSGIMPIINSMAAAGVVSLPGMMTGQILAGASPVHAVNYQILIMFLISAGTLLGTMGAVWMGSRRLFDHRQRLRLDRLHRP